MISLDHVNIGSENPLYLISVEEINEDKYLIFASTNRNKKILENTEKIHKKTSNQIETINAGEPIEYKKDFIKIRLE